MSAKKLCGYSDNIQLEEVAERAEESESPKVEFSARQDRRIRKSIQDGAKDLFLLENIEDVNSVLWHGISDNGKRKRVQEYVAEQNKQDERDTQKEGQAQVWGNTIMSNIAFMKLIDAAKNRQVFFTARDREYIQRFASPQYLWSTETASSPPYS